MRRSELSEALHMQADIKLIHKRAHQETHQEEESSLRHSTCELTSSSSTSVRIKRPTKMESAEEAAPVKRKVATLEAICKEQLEKVKLHIQTEAAMMESAEEAASVKKKVATLEVICRKRQMKLRTLIVLADEAVPEEEVEAAAEEMEVKKLHRKLILLTRLLMLLLRKLLLKLKKLMLMMLLS